MSVYVGKHTMREVLTCADRSEESGLNEHSLWDVPSESSADPGLTSLLKEQGPGQLPFLSSV